MNPNDEQKIDDTEEQEDKNKVRMCDIKSDGNGLHLFRREAWCRVVFVFPYIVYNSVERNADYTNHEYRQYLKERKNLMRIT